MSADNCSNRLSTVSCKVVSEYFHSKLVMEEKSTQQINEKQSTSKGKQAKPNKAIKKPRKKVKGQKDIRSLIKTKNDLLKYSKDFDFVCKQAGIDVDPEQLQLAIALSKSLQESEPAAKDETDTKKSLTSNQRRGQIKITLKEYGFKVPVTQKDSKKRIKRYRKQYKLLLVSETEKQRLIADKYSQLLFRHASICKISEENLSKYQNSDSHLYYLSTNIPYACMKDDDIFYVNDLVSKSLNHKHDMLRDWSQIPGRPVSPQLVRDDICFKSTPFTHEELNSILSGTIEKAQYIVSQNHIMNNRDSERTNSDNAYSNPVLIDIEPTVSGLEIISQNTLNIEQNTPSVVEMDSNKSHEDYVCGGVIDVESYRYDIQTTNRSGSPDLFDDDDDATILLDTSTEKVSSHEGVTRRTMVRENDFMDLTKCVDAMNYNNTKLKQNSCLSQRTNKTRTYPNDFMDLTHCVTATSQKILNDIYCTDKNAKCMDNDNVKETNALTVDLNSSPNSNSELLATSNSNCKEKSMDDTIIMLDENYYRTECNPANLTSKETGIIDLDEDHCCPQILTNILNHSKYNLEKSQYIDNPNNASPRPFQGEYKCLDMGGMVPAEPSITEDNLSFVHIQSVQSIVMYENCDKEYEVNNMSNEHFKSKINGIENHVELDLTQSSNSADSLQFVQEVCTNNESQDETLILKNDDYKSNNMQNEENLKYMSENNHKCVGEKPENQCEINLDCSREHNLQENVSISSQPTLISNDRNKALNIDGAVNYDNNFFENDPDTQNHEFDFIQQSKEGLHEAKEDHSLSNENNSFFTTEQYQYKVDFVDDREIVDILENVSSKQNNVDTFKSYDSNFSGVNVTNEENKPGCENDSHVQNDSDIDLTQQSDSSEGKNSSQNVIEIPTDLGKINDVSIDYDDLCIEVEELATRNCNVLVESNTSRVIDEGCSEEKAAIIDDISIKVQEQIATKSPFKNYIYKDKSCSQVETGNNVYDDSCIAVKEKTTRISNKTIQNPHKRDSSLEKDKSLCKDEAITSSSQHSEVFEISDDEIDYSMNQHIQESDSIQVEHAKFDIGGMSIINEFLNRKSVSRKSKQLRCSCSSNTGLSSNDDKDENCLPVVTLRSHYNETRKSKSFSENNAVKISIPLRSRSDDNVLAAQTPKHNDYIVKTDNVTPMPNYELMLSPERNEELDKFGIKPLKRRRAIQILTHIYNQTHPVMEVISENEPWSSPSKIRRKNDEMSFPRRVIASQIDDIVRKTSIESHVSTIEPYTSTYELPESSNTCKGSKRSPIFLTKSQLSPECPKNAKKESQLYDETKSLPDIKDIQCSPEDWVFQKREKAKVHSCRVPLHIAFHNYVSCRQSLREAILRYEPIRIDSIHKGLVASGYKYNPKDLLKFMDKKCITVKTADNSRKNENKNK